MTTLTQTTETADELMAAAAPSLVTAFLAARALQRRLVLATSMLLIACAIGLAAGLWDRLYPQPDLVTFAFRV
jgi:hypothetical protein